MSIGTVGRFNVRKAFGIAALALAAMISLGATAARAQDSNPSSPSPGGDGKGFEGMATASVISGAMTIGAGDISTTVSDCQKNNCIIFDVRPKANFTNGHLRGALSMDTRYSAVRQDHVGDLSILGTDKSKMIVVYGENATDRVAESVVRQAVAEGFTNVVWMRGGFSEWVSARLPTTTS